MDPTLIPSDGSAAERPEDSAGTAWPGDVHQQYCILDIYC